MAALRLPFVLAGWIGITALIALNRGIDLLWGVVILLIFATLAAAVLPKLQLFGVGVRRLQFPATAVVDEPQRVGYEIDATSPLPRYGLEIHERLDGQDEYALAGFVPRIRGRTQLFFQWTPRVRGCWRLGELVLESRYPLGLMRSRRTLATPEVDREILVYPDFVQLRWLPVLDDTSGSAEWRQAPRRGGHDEFFALKPYRHGDEARSIHWRASARLGEIVTREYEQQESRQLWIVLELSASAHVGTGRDGTCEQMIRIAHSAAVKAHADGIPVGLLYRVADSVQRIPAGADRSTYEHVRDSLARVQAHAQVPVHAWLQKFHDRTPMGGTWLIFNLAGEEQRAVLQTAVSHRAAKPLLVEFDEDSFSRREQSQVTTLRTAHGMVSVVPYGADLTELFRP